jgi:agmatine deiminase
MATEHTPNALGYRMPAEWEPHAATWLSWPRNKKSWPGHFEPIPGVWAELAATLAQSEPVHICAGGDDVMAEARRLVGHLANVTLHDIPTNDAWMRDHGPMFLVGPRGAEPAMVDWNYNAWGGKYPPFDHDDAVPRLINKGLRFLRFEPGIVLEGGAVDFNGRGSVLTTEQCLLNENRNSHLGRADMERYLLDYCAARNVVWLGEGIVGDDTDGHIDELARFVNPRTVVCVVEQDPRDENYAPLQDNLRRLQLAKDEEGRSLEVVPLPMPAALFCDDQRLPASYCNFYIANKVVVAAQFDCPADAIVLDTLTKLFPDRRVVGQRAVELVWGLGAFHCITQQQAERGETMNDER